MSRKQMLPARSSEDRPTISSFAEEPSNSTLEEATTAPAPDPAPPPAEDLYEVTEFCGTLRHNGRSYDAGQCIALSKETAEALGAAVKPAKD